MEYSLNLEVKKINSAFARVKEDMLSLRDDNSFLREEIAYLRAKIDDNSNNIEKNKENITDFDKKEIIANSDSKKYHYSDCPYAKRMNNDKKVAFNDIASAVKEGFDECPCIRN